LINEYIAYKKNTENNKWKLLQIANYSEMVNWSVRYLKNKIIEKDERQYSFMKLNDLLVRNREYITIENSNEYKRVTVKLNNNGVVLRDKVRGYDIGTKKQFKISKGQLIISKIGASDGAIGIVPNDLDKAIVTSDFLTYTVNTKFVLPEYLEFLIATSDFKTYLEQLNRGTTIPRLNEDLFLNTLIPVPSLEEQSVLSKKIFNLKKQLNKLETSLADEREKFKKTMFSK
jgi:type I restriction enzyme S subunit